MVEESEKFLDGGKLPCLLVENKIDLLEEPNDGKESLNQFAKDNDFCGCFRTSAKTGFNIKESMVFFIKLIIEKMKDIKELDVDETFTRDTITIKDKSSFIKKPEPKKCC